ncbi:hypothetical protein TKK_0008824 [Trichogramma kaykai]
MKLTLLTFAALVALSIAQPLETTPQTIEKQSNPLHPPEIHLEGDAECDCNESLEDEWGNDKEPLPTPVTPPAHLYSNAVSKIEAPVPFREVPCEKPIASNQVAYSEAVLVDNSYKAPVKNSEIFYEAPVPSREVSFEQLIATNQGVYNEASLAEHATYEVPIKNSQIFYQAPVPSRQVPFRTSVPSDVIVHKAITPPRHRIYNLPISLDSVLYNSYPVQKPPTYNVNFVASVPTFNRNTFPWPQKTVYRYNTSISGRPVIDFLKNPFVKFGSFLKKSANHISNKHRFTPVQTFGNSPLVIDN